MPIGNIHKSGNSFTGISGYTLAQGKYEQDQATKKPEIIVQNLIFSNQYKEIGKEFRNVAQENQNVKKPVMHYSVSFSKDDKTTQAQQVEAVKMTMEHLGIKEDNHQYMIVKHNDNNPHYHIIVNRVGLDGKTLNDQHTKRRLEVAIDKAEKVLGLDNSLSQKRSFVYDPSEKLGYRKQSPLKEKIQGKELIKTPKDKELNLQAKKQFIQDNINKALTNENPKTADELKQILKKEHISFQYNTNVKGLSGTSFSYQGYSVKGSAVGFKASTIAKQFDKNKRHIEKGVENSQSKIGLQEFDTNVYKSLRSIEDEFKKGIKPDYQKHFSNNGLKLNNDYSIQNNNHLVKTCLVKTFERNEMALNQATERLKVNKQAYDKLMNEKPKKTLGLFENKEQKEYNERLKLQQENVKEPHLKVETSVLQDYEKEIHNALKAEFESIKKQPKEQVYILEAKREKAQEQAKEKSQERTEKSSFDLIKERREDKAQEQEQSNKRGRTR